MAGSLTPHFTRAELNYDAAPLAVRANLERLALFLEDVRAVVGVPLRVTSGYRSPASNAATVGASATSQHVDGTAADFVPVGITSAEFVRRLGGSALMDRFGQLIVYPLTTDHVHLSLPTRGVVGQLLVETSADASRPSYAPYTVALVASLGAEKKASTVAGAALALGGLGTVTLLSQRA